MQLSIITINYNNLEGLRETAKSIISQTWKDFEWIIIDGGSSDGSKEYIINLNEILNLKGWNPISHWCSEPDNGIYNAMNKGIEKARGNYLQFLNSGDILHDKEVMKSIEVELCGEDVIYGDLKFVSKENNYVFIYPNKLTTHYLLHRSLGHPATFIKSCLFDSEGYREDLRIVSDWYSFIKWFRQGKSFRHINTIVSDFDANGISSNNREKLEEERKTVFFELFGEDNLQWINESIQMHMQEERFTQPPYFMADRIIKYGGIRKTILSFFLNVINKTI